MDINKIYTRAFDDGHLKSFIQILAHEGLLNRYVTIDDFNHDILEYIINEEDWSALNFLLDFDIDLVTGIRIDRLGASHISPLLYFLDNELSAAYTYKLMKTKYNVDAKTLLYSASKNGLKIAIDNLISYEQYDHKTLKRSLSVYNDVPKSILRALNYDKYMIYMKEIPNIFTTK